MAQYFALRARSDPDGCFVDRPPEGMEFPWELCEGAPAAHLGRLRLRMSSRIGGKAVSDAVRNSLGWLVVSQGVRKVLQDRPTGPVEFVPVDLVDHKGRVVPRAFFAANVLTRVDCVDRKLSRYESSDLAPGEFAAMQRIELVAAAVPPNLDLFRLAPLPRVLLVRDDLASALRKAAPDGFEYLPTGVDLAEEL